MLESVGEKQSKQMRPFHPHLIFLELFALAKRRNMRIEIRNGGHWSRAASDFLGGKQRANAPDKGTL